MVHGAVTLWLCNCVTDRECGARHRRIAPSSSDPWGRARECGEKWAESVARQGFCSFDQIRAVSSESGQIWPVFGKWFGLLISIKFGGARPDLGQICVVLSTTCELARQVVSRGNFRAVFTSRPGEFDQIRAESGQFRTGVSNIGQFWSSFGKFWRSPIEH